MIHLLGLYHCICNLNSSYATCWILKWFYFWTFFVHNRFLTSRFSIKIMNNLVSIIIELWQEVNEVIHSLDCKTNKVASHDVLCFKHKVTLFLWIKRENSTCLKYSTTIVNEIGGWPNTAIWPFTALGTIYVWVEPSFEHTWAWTKMWVFPVSRSTNKCDRCHHAYLLWNKIIVLVADHCNYWCICQVYLL